MRLEAARAGMRVGGIRARLAQTAAAERAYGQAIGVLNGLVSDRPAERDYRDALAQAHLELAAVFRTEERWTESEREIQGAAALWDALAREQPAIASYRSKLGDAHGRLGDQYQIQGRVNEAEAAIGQALVIADRLAREYPEVNAYQESLATILSAFGKLQTNRLDDWPGANVSLQRAVEIGEKLARDQPGVTKYQLGLGVNLGTLGYVLALEKKFPQAEAAVNRSIAILEKLAADHPEDMNIAGARARSYWRMKAVLSQRGDHQAALETSGRLIEMLRLLARRDPNNLRIGRRELWEALAERAESWTRLGRLTESLADFQEARELTHGTEDEELFRAFSALTKARLGDLSESALQRDRLRDTVMAGSDKSGKKYSYWMLFYDAACLHAALAKHALEDPGTPPVRRRQLAQPDLERVLDLLEKARSDGEFKGMVRLDEVRRERLLDPLRDDPRFQRLISLMMDLEFPDDPFRP
jgi:tetratricopeptide (TPR) repeat protein